MSTAKGFVLFIFSLILVSAQAHEDISFAPPHLDDQGLVFVDFKKAHYEIDYNVQERKAFVTTQIRFSIPKEGKPLFDLVPNVSEAFLDGYPVEIEETLLDGGISRMKFADHVIRKGTHILELKSEIDRLLDWNSTYVRSAFWMSDLSDRRFLEAYIPSNLDFDKVEMSFDIKISETTTEHVLKTNCKTRAKSTNHFLVDCPKYFNNSMFFYHLYEEGHLEEQTVYYASIDGREIPITAYSRRNRQVYIDKALKVIKELEEDYGAWPHPQMLIYGDGWGGMEYAGATQTSLSALGHEMHHSYFARSKHPSLGNSGWVDEALASWRDNGYDTRQSAGRRTQMAGHSVYQRKTDTDAYGAGARLMAHLDHRFQEQGGLRSFLKDWFQHSPRGAFTTEMFRDEMGKFYNDSLVEFFDEYIYGKNGVDASKVINPLSPIFDYHPLYSEEDLKKLL